MTTDQPAAISVNLEPAIQDVALRLAREFAATFPAATVEEYVRSSYGEISSRATVPTFVPVLTERFARERLRALATVEGHEAKALPSVLFLCVHNAGRSQMALGFFKHHAEGRAIAWSGGSAPKDSINPVAIEAMAERGIDISGEYPKPWTDEVLRAADVVITMGCGDTCPYYPGKRYEDWVLDDPAGQGIEAVRPTRDEIERRVLTLLAELGVAA